MKTIEVKMPIAADIPEELLDIVIMKLESVDVSGAFRRIEKGYVLDIVAEDHDLNLSVCVCIGILIGVVLKDYILP